MHHKNNRFSTSNHNNPQHMKPDDLPNKPSPGGAYTPKKSNFLKQIAGRFKEKPATEEEVKQLKLDAQREIFKTAKQKAKANRPSRFSFGNETRQPSYRKSSKYAQEDNSFLFGNSKSTGSGFLDSSWTPGLSMFGGNPQQSKKSNKNQKSGLEELF